MKWVYAINAHIESYATMKVNTENNVCSLKNPDHTESAKRVNTMLLIESNFRIGTEGMGTVKEP